MIPQEERDFLTASVDALGFSIMRNSSLMKSLIIVVISQNVVILGLLGLIIALLTRP